MLHVSLDSLSFWALSQNFKKRPLASSCLPARPSVHLPVRMEQLDYRWTHFHEMLYLRSNRKSVDEIQVSL